MRIGVISDTHIPSAGPEPPAQVRSAFAGVDLILHAGHANVASCLEWLGSIAPVHSTESWLEGQGETPMRHGRVDVYEFEGHTIGMTHELILRRLGDDVLPGSLGRSPRTLETLPADLEEIFGKAVDIVVFGYTHEAMVEAHAGILFVNPGSTNLVKQQVRLGTVAILEIGPGSCEAHVVDLAEFT